MKRRKQNPFPIVLCIFVLIILLSIIGFVIIKISEKPNNKENSSVSSSVADESIVSSEVVSSAVSSSSEESSSVTENFSITSSTADGKLELNPDFSKLLLVNGKNPLPKDYDYEGDLKTIPNKYLSGWRNQINKDIYHYLIEMVEDAWSDGVELYIQSPYRSYSVQETLFENETQKWLKTGMSRVDAENKAATIVARPGTSEHHTGLAIDFNPVDESFENTESYRWLSENAENYGFIMRYSEEKQPITGVIHETWHWRFVGINHAKEIKNTGLCLEEYLEKLNNSSTEQES